MFSLAFIRDNFTFILSALPVTLVITLLSLLFSTLLGAALAWVLFLVVAVFASIAFKSSKYWVFYSADKGGKNG